MKLTDRQCAACAPGDREYLLGDGGGLSLRVRPDGSKGWIFRYRNEAGKAVKLGLGLYPKVGLAAAREKANDKRKLHDAGKDPKREKIEKSIVARKRRLDTFEKVARAWHRHATVVHEWSESYSHKQLRMLERHAIDDLGNNPIGLIDQIEVYAVLEKVSLAGTRETAIRLRESLQRIYRYAVTQGVLTVAENFMAPQVADFKLPAPRVHHHASLRDPAKVGQLMRDLRAYRGHFVTQCMLQVMPMLFQRPGQVRFMEWDQIDFEAGLWTCPPAIMKMTKAAKESEDAEPHIVPLPRQVLAILADLYRLTGHSGPVFKSVSRRSRKDGSYSRYICENTVNAALRSMGYDTQKQITGHGYRSMARTMLKERLGWDKEVIERHLAHTSDEELGEAYDRTRFIEQRREMVQAWADYLDQLAGTRPPAALSLVA